MRIRLLPLPLLVLAGTVSAASPEPVALVYSVMGDGATQVVPGAKDALKLELFAWLREGTSVTAPARGRVSLAFVDGSRLELGPKASATLGANGLTAKAGEVKELPKVPPFPAVTKVASGLGSQPAGGNGKDGGAQPPRTARVLAETATLEWPSVAGAIGYHVTIDAEDGRNVYQSDTATNSLRVPASLLQPGAVYSWRVNPTLKVGVGVVPRRNAVLQVLTADVVKARKAFQASLRQEGGADALALLSEVDRSLGLHAEANRELTEAIGLLPRGEQGRTSALGRIPINRQPTPAPEPTRRSEDQD